MGGSPLAFILCQGTCIGHVRWACGKCSFLDPHWGLKNSLLCAHANLPQCASIPAHLPVSGANFCAPTGGQQYTRVKMLSSPISCLRCSKTYSWLTSQRHTKRCPLRGFQKAQLKFNIGTMGTFVILIILSNVIK